MYRTEKNAVPNPGNTPTFFEQCTRIRLYLVPKIRSLRLYLFLRLMSFGIYLFPKIRSLRLCLFLRLWKYLVVPVPEGKVPSVEPVPEGKVPSVEHVPEGKVPNVEPVPEGKVRSVEPVPEGKVPIVLNLFRKERSLVLYLFHVGLSRAEPDITVENILHYHSLSSLSNLKFARRLWLSVGDHAIIFFSF